MNRNERRAAAFGRWFDERMCTRVEPWRWGTVYVDDDFPRCLDTNFLLLEGAPSDITAEHFVGEAQRVFGGPGPRPVRIVVEEPTMADRLGLGCQELGWPVLRFLLMVHRGRVSAPPGLPSAGECVLETIRPLLEEVTRRGPGAGDEAATRMLVDFRAKVADRIGTRFFAAPMDGPPSGICELHVRGADAQIDLVNTLEGVRGRGIATAVVLSAVEAAHEAGARWIHLYRDAAGWPQRWYRRLGFRDAGGVAEIRG